jgi:hypothetical protein
MATTETLAVLESFVGLVSKGDERIFRQGDLIRANDPAVKKWPHLFGAPTYPHETRVEQATASPGEKRA